ncbi:MAG: hypothetical protein ACRD20_17300 [Terriglobales bacterium]
MLTKKEDASEFEKLEQQLHSFLAEIAELSRKKPNDPVNRFKLKFINATLDKMNTLLADMRPFGDFQQFDVDEIPSNSDVVVILSQYAASMYRFRLGHTEFGIRDRRWYWIVRGKVSDISTKSPGDSKYHPK